MSELDRVNKAWERIEAWYSKNMPDAKFPEGTTEAKISALEKKINVELPKGLRVSLLHHDGMEHSWPRRELLSVKGIESKWSIWTSLLDSGTFEDFKPDKESEGKLHQGWWNKEWVPINRDGGGNAACIDLKPGPKGKKEQVINMDHEIGPEGPLFPDFAAYLEDIASQLEAGKYKYEGRYLVEDDNRGGESNDNDDEEEKDKDYE